VKAFLAMGLQILAAGGWLPGLVMPWFAPVAVLLGFVGTWNGMAFRQATGKSRRDAGWWWIILFFWMPLLIWILVQFTPQD